MKAERMLKTKKCYDKIPNMSFGKTLIYNSLL